MLIIGSVALQFYKGLTDEVDGGPLFPFSSSSYKVAPKDFDAIVTPDEFKAILNGLMEEGKIADIMRSAPNCYALKLKPDCGEEYLIHEYTVAYPQDSNTRILAHSKVKPGERDYASLEVLLMMKMSHRFKKNSPHFTKTMADIRFLRDVLKVQEPAKCLDKELEAIYKLRQKETYTYAHPSLSQSKGEFFNKEETFYVWDHDDIHLAVKTLMDKPAYQYFQPEGSEVQTSKKMWDRCPHEVKLRAGLEESMVLAIERSLVPHPGVLTPKEAFDKALEKVCTSITSGWFREFCWEHYHEIQALYDDEFVTKFENAVAQGKIKPFSKTAFPLNPQ